MLDDDTRCSEVEPGTEELLEDTGGVQWRRRSRSKIYKATGKTWTRGLHCFVQDVEDAGFQELLVGVNEHVADGVLIDNVDVGNVEAAQRLLGGDVAWLRWVHWVLLELIRGQEVHRVAANCFAEFLGIGGRCSGS